MPTFPNLTLYSDVRSLLNDNGLRKNNFTADRAPTAGDDLLGGWEVGSMWVYNNVAYICTDASSGAAVWKASLGGSDGSEFEGSLGDLEEIMEQLRDDLALASAKINAAEAEAAAASAAARLALDEHQSALNIIDGQVQAIRDEVDQERLATAASLQADIQQLENDFIVADAGITSRLDLIELSVNKSSFVRKIDGDGGVGNWTPLSGAAAPVVDATIPPGQSASSSIRIAAPGAYEPPYYGGVSLKNTIFRVRGWVKTSAGATGRVAIIGSTAGNGPGGMTTLAQTDPIRTNGSWQQIDLQMTVAGDTDEWSPGFLVTGGTISFWRIRLEDFSAAAGLSAAVQSNAQAIIDEASARAAAISRLRTEFQNADSTINANVSNLSGAISDETAARALVVQNLESSFRTGIAQTFPSAVNSNNWRHNGAGEPNISGLAPWVVINAAGYATILASDTENTNFLSQATVPWEQGRIFRITTAIRSAQSIGNPLRLYFLGLTDSYAKSGWQVTPNVNLTTSTEWQLASGEYTLPARPNTDTTQLRLGIVLIESITPDVNIDIQSIRIEDVTHVRSLGADINATLTNSYYTKTDAESAIASAVNALDTKYFTPTGQVKATSLTDYYTKAAANSAIAAYTNNLSSQILGTDGQVRSTLLNGYYTKAATDSAISTSVNNLDASLGTFKSNVTNTSTAVADLRGSLATFKFLAQSGSANAAGITAVSMTRNGNDTVVNTSSLVLHGDNVIAPGTLSTNALVVGLGKNLLIDPSFDDGLAHYSFYSNNGATSSVRGPGVSYSHAAWPTLEIFQGNATSTGFSEISTQPVVKADGTRNPGVPVSPRKRYCASVYYNAHRCGFCLYIQWIDGAGSSMSGAPQTEELTGSDGSNINPDTWQRASVFGVAPNGAVSARLIFRKFGTTSGTDSYLFIWKPQLEEVHAQASEPSVWSPGGTTYINGGRLFANSVTAREAYFESLAALGLKVGRSDMLTAAIGNAQIGDLEIRRGKIGNNELTTHWSINSNTITISVPDPVRLTILTAVRVAGISNPYTSKYIIKVNGNIISTGLFSLSQYTYHLPNFAYTSLPAGTHTITHSYVRESNDEATGDFSNHQLVILGQFK